MKRNIILLLAFIVSIGFLLAQDNVTITNVSINPNPFSPDNDGQRDNTTISYYLYFPNSLSNPEVELTIYKNSDITDIVKQVVYTPYHGQNQYIWDGKDEMDNIVADGNYGLQIKFNNPQKIYKVDRGIIVQTTYPEIELISASPNPFSPNGDGYQDVQIVRSLIKYSDVHYLGTIKINFQDSTAKFVDDTDLTTRVSPNPIPYSEGAYLFLNRPAELATNITVPSNIDYNIIVNGFEENITRGNTLYKLGENYNRSYGSISSDIGIENNTLISYGVDYLAVYAMPNNMSFNVYETNGEEISLNDMYHMFFGSFNDNPFDRTDIDISLGRAYSINLGTEEGQIPGDELDDGKYLYRLTVSNEYELGTFISGEFIINNHPISIDGEVNPDKISPQIIDGIFDQTIIQYTPSEDAYITVKVWDTNNQLIKTIIENQLNLKEVGNYVLWNGSNNLGQIVSEDSEELYRVEITAVDRNINEDVTSLNLSILVDNKAPDAPNLTQGTPNQLSSPNIVVSGISDEINSSIILFQNGIEKGVVGTTPAYPGYFQFNVLLEEGNNEIFVKLRDSVHNLGESSNQINYYLDSQAPVISLIQPPANTIFTSIPQEFSAQVTDNGLGVNFVRFGFSFNNSPNLIWKTGIKDPDTEIYRCNLTNTDINENISQLAISMFIESADNLNNRIILENPISYNYFKPSATNPPNFENSYPEDNSNLRILANNQIRVTISSDNPLVLNTTATYLVLKNILSGEEISHNNGATLNYDYDFEENNYHIILQLINPLSSDGADDSQYQIIYNAENQVGQTITGHTMFNYDTTNPFITSIKINQSQLFKVNNQYYFSSQIDSISVYLDDSLSDIDYATNMTRVQLYNDNNQIINGIRRIDTNTGRITWLLNNPINLDNTNQNLIIKIKATDKAGNIFTENIPFHLFSPELPQLIEHTPIANSKINTFNQISKKVLDTNGFGLDRANTNITLISPTNTYQNGDGARLTFTNLNNNIHQISLNLINPLTTDGSDDGMYTVQTTITDTVGQNIIHNMIFTYDTQTPVVSNQKIGGVDWEINFVDNSTINQDINYISLDLTDLTTQVNFNSSQTYLFVYNSQNQLLAGTKTINENTIKYTLTNPLLNNGSHDGAYYAKYSAIDQAGNIKTGQINFRLINPSAPQITNIYPANNTILNQLTDNKIIVEFDDDRPIDLQDISNTYIKLISPNNTVIAHNNGANQVIESIDNDTYRVTLTLVQSLNLNGVYTMQTKLQNAQGYYTEFNTQFTFDNQDPIIQTVKLGLTNGSENTISDNESIYSAVNYVKVSLTDHTSGIDYTSDNTQILVSIDGDSIAGTLEKNAAENYIKYTFVEPLTELDTQVSIQTSADDLAGNSADKQLSFTLNALQANIVSISPANNSFINQNLNQIKLIVDFIEEVDLNENLTYLRLKHPNGSYIENGQGANLQFIKNNNRYEINLNFNQALANNGQDDGEYEIYALIATDSYQEGPISFSFTYDRLTPYYENLAINEMIVNSGERLLNRVNSKTRSRNGLIFSEAITKVQVDYHDLISQVNYATNLTSITLLSPSGSLVQGSRIVNGTTVSWVLNNPIPVDGTKDGLYTINMKATDYAGNILNTSYTFTLMSHIIPELVGYTPENVLNHYVNSFSPAVITGSFKNTIPVVQDPALTYIALTFPNGEIAEHAQGANLSYQVEQNNLKATLQLTSGLNTNGENDGEYTVHFHATNQYGAEYDTSMNFIYDTIKPSYTDLVLSGGNIEYPVTENSIISNSFNSVQVKYTDITSGIHFAPNITSIALYDPDNNLITGNHSYIGQGDDRVCRWAFQDPNAIILDGTKDGIYTIKLKATDKAGNSFSKDISFNVISIIPPQNLNTYLDAVHNIHISWNNPNPNRKKNNSRSVGNYQIFRKIDESEFVQIAQTANLYYIDNLQEANDGTYTYMVKALYTIPGNSQIIPSDGTISDPIILKRFTPCTFNITLSDNQQASNILFHLLGNDGLYNQELNMTTNQSGVISLPAIYMTDYLLTLSKEGYQTIVDTISIDLATNEFTYILQKIDRQQGGRPDNYALYQNFPNPFNPTTEIRFALKSNSFVDLAVYNVKGQKIKQLHNQNLEYGYHKVVWDGKDNSDKKVSSGIYFYILNVRSNEDSYKEIRKMLMVK